MSNVEKELIDASRHAQNVLLELENILKIANGCREAEDPSELLNELFDKAKQAIIEQDKLIYKLGIYI